MNAVAESFSWPFRGEWRSRWAAGVLIVLFLPVLFVPLLGYAIAATRSAEHEPSLAPPPWRLSARLLSDGLWTAILIALLASPFVMAFDPLAGLLLGAPLWHTGNLPVAQLYAHVSALFILVLCWGLVMLLLMPHAAARFAFTGRPIDLFNFPSAIRGVVRDFARWNLAAAAIVTGWALGVACVGLLCIGLVPGVFYAILVSAHACAALHIKGANSPPR